MSDPLNMKDLPADFAVALITERPEILEYLYRPNGLNEKETSQVSRAFSALIQANVDLKQRLARMIQIINHVYSMDLDLSGEVYRLRDLANLSSRGDQECQGK